MKLTALDILHRAGVETPGDKIGKVSVSIGGVVANDPNKVINLQTAEEVEVIVGNESFTADLTKDVTEAEAERVSETKRADGEKKTEAFVASQTAKAEAGELGDEDRAKRTLEKRGIVVE